MNFKEYMDALQRMVIPPDINSGNYEKWLQQEDFFKLLGNITLDNSEIPIWVSTKNITICSILFPKKLISKIPKQEMINWDCFPGETCFLSEEGNFGSKKTKWSIAKPLANSKPPILSKAQPLIYSRTNSLNRRRELELDQNFQHLHDLYMEEYKDYFTFYSIDKENKEELIFKYVIKESGDEFNFNIKEIITIKGNILDMHLKLSNTVLIRLFDSICVDDIKELYWKKESLIENEAIQLFTKFGINSKVSYLRGYQIINPTKKRLNTILNPIKKKKYETFIAYDWKNDKEGKFSCDPKKLGNYFVESNLPYEITPVFFNAEVLSKYKSNPDKYLIEERRISCLNSWSLQTYDINEAEQVHTYLIYLGMLPENEQMYWKSFNEKAKAGISARAYLTDILGKFDDAINYISNFKCQLNYIGSKFPAFWSFPDKNLFKQLHYPISNSHKEWADMISLLNRIFIEGIEKKYLVAKANELGIAIEKESGTIQIIGCILKTLQFEQIDKIVPILKEIPFLRSKFATAHRNSSKFDINDLVKEYGSLNKHFKKLLEKTNVAIALLIKALEKSLL